MLLMRGVVHILNMLINKQQNINSIIKYDSNSFTYIIYEIYCINMYNLLAPWIITATIRP